MPGAGDVRQRSPVSRIEVRHEAVWGNQPVDIMAIEPLESGDGSLSPSIPDEGPKGSERITRDIQILETVWRAEPVIAVLGR